MFRMKVHRGEDEVLVAAADEDLVGETFREEGVRLAVEEAFFAEVAADPGEVLGQLKACTMANLVGEDLVELAVEHGYVDPDAVARVDGVPHAHVTRMRER